jgi:hypothetical protein
MGAELLEAHGFGQIAKRPKLPVARVVNQDNPLGARDFGAQRASKAFNLLKGLKIQCHLQGCGVNATRLSGQGDNPIAFLGKEGAGLTANSGAGTGYQG